MIFDLSKYCKLSTILILICIISACKEPLYTKLSEEDANEMMSILMNNGIDTEKKIDKKDQSIALFVEKNQIPTAFTLLKQGGYPREPFKKMIDIFDKQGLISSPMEERVRFIYALTQEVQETLSQIDGVITARVHLVLPDNNPFSDDVKPSSASVFIKALPSSHLEEIKSEIKFIVEKSIEGLKYEKISVVLLPAKINVELSEEVLWSNVFGIRLPRDSVNMFKYFIGIFVSVMIFAIAVIAYLLTRLMKLTNNSDDKQGVSKQVTIDNAPSMKDKLIASGPGGKVK